MPRELGRKYDAYVCHQVLKPEEERRLGLLAREGDEQAIDDLTTNNLRLVVFMAERFYKPELPVDFDDIVSAGVDGLGEAAKRYDPDKGSKFSSYALWWIKQRMKRRIMEWQMPMRVPVTVARRRMKVSSYIKKYVADNGCHPDLDELKERFPEFSKQMLRAFMQIQGAVYLDAPIVNGELDDIAELVADTKAVRPGDRLINSENAGEIERLFTVLKMREQLILELRFGLGGGRTHTLDEISKIIARTRERVRQIEKRALQKLKEYSEKFEVGMK